MLNKFTAYVLMVFGILLIYITTLGLYFMVACIPSMMLAYIIKTFFTVSYTFWQITVGIAIGFTILGGRIRR